VAPLAQGAQSASQVQPARQTPSTQAFVSEHCALAVHGGRGRSSGRQMPRSQTSARLGHSEVCAQPGWQKPLMQAPAVEQWAAYTHCPPDRSSAWQKPSRQVAPVPQTSPGLQARWQAPAAQRAPGAHSRLKRQARPHDDAPGAPASQPFPPAGSGAPAS
jgi:hypothetical protein